MTRSGVRFGVAAIVMTMGLAAGSAVWAQAPAAPAAPNAPRAPRPDAGRIERSLTPDMDRRNAEELRNDFREVMRRYPPALGEVLKVDPTLMSNSQYLQTYPALANFLAAHPEVPRSPDYFLDFARTASDHYQEDNSPTALMMRQIDRMTESFSILFVVSVVAFSITWLIRHGLAHRRWLRATKLQTDVHNKLMERLTTSEDVQSYLQSAASNKLFTDVPLMAESGGPGMGAPVSRILWSVQAGMVIAAAGIGLLIGRRYLPLEGGEFLGMPAIVLMAVGLGFVAAAAVSYILSSRLGLFDRAASPVAGRERA